MTLISLERRIMLQGRKKTATEQKKTETADKQETVKQAEKLLHAQQDTDFFGKAAKYRYQKAMGVAQESGVLNSLLQLVHTHKGEVNSYRLMTPLIDSRDNKTNQRYDLDYSSKLAAWRMQTKFWGVLFASGIEHELHPLKLQASLHPELKIDTHVPRFLRKGNKKEYSRTKEKLKQLFPVYTMTLIKGEQKITQSEKLLGVDVMDIKATDKITIQISTNPHYPSITIIGGKKEGTFTPKDWKMLQRPRRNKKEQVGGILGFRTGRDAIQDALIKALGNPQHDEIEKKTQPVTVRRRISTLPPELVKIHN